MTKQKNLDTLSEEYFSFMKNTLRDIVNKEKSAKEQYELLLDIATSNSVFFEFEKIYSIIFGSQITLLKELANEQILYIEDAKEFYDIEKRKRVIDNAPMFYKWINFLIENNLIIEFSEKRPFYVLKDKGAAFLLYLQDNEYDLKENQL